jgi:predicted GIY-YIG superfamily endonuclease
MFTLYRHYDKAGKLLYVGQTNDPPRRLREHQDYAGWWDKVSCTWYEHFNFPEEVADAEKIAIATESPIWNLSHNPQAKVVPESWPPVIKHTFTALDDQRWYSIRNVIEKIEQEHGVAHTRDNINKALLFLWHKDAIDKQATAAGQRSFWRRKN